MERTRDRRRRHRQHVDARPQRLEPLLDVDAETLLLVNDQEPEVVEVDVGLGKPMGADDDVDGASGEPSSVSRSSAGEQNRDSDRTVKGNSENRAAKLRRCCSQSTVVGTRTAT